MKVLFVNEYANPVSGAEFSQNELARAIKAQVFSPQWFMSGSSRGISPLWFNNPFYYLYSAWQISRQKFDLIHVHGKYILPGAVIAGWLSGKPVVITVRDFKFLCPLALCFIDKPRCTWKYFIGKEINEYRQRYQPTPKLILILAKLWQYQLKWWLNCCNRVIAVSPQLKKIYQDNGVRHVSWIYNLPSVRQAQGQIIKQKNMILSVGKLSYGKGTDMIIKAAKLLPQFQFVFAGRLNSSLKPDFPKNCRYLGQVSHETTRKLCRQAGVFVINSRWPEPLSRAGLEALSFGLPIVASNRGGNQELVKDNGYLIDPDQSESMVKAIRQAYSQADKLGKNSLKLIKTRFNRDKIIKQYEEIYRLVD